MELERNEAFNMCRSTFSSAYDMFSERGRDFWYSVDYVKNVFSNLLSKPHFYYFEPVKNVLKEM